MKTYKTMISLLLLLFLFIPVFAQNSYSIHVYGNGDLTTVIFSGDYSGEETPPFEIGPSDSPFTVTLEVTNFSGSIHHDNGSIESYSFDGFYIEGELVPDGIIVVDESQPEVYVEVWYYRESTTPSPPTSAPTPDLTPGPDTGILGDVNRDESVTIIDALLVAQYYVGLDPQNFDVTLADTNCDGSINVIDALLIAQYVVGLISEFC